MANVLIEQDTMEEIGEAIREKTGDTALLLPSEMPNAIRGISGAGGIVITGSNGQYAFSSNLYTGLVDSISTSDLTDIDRMYANNYSNNVDDYNSIVLNLKPNYSGVSLTNIFYGNWYRTAVPEVVSSGNVFLNTNMVFCDCYRLQEIPGDWLPTFDTVFWDRNLNSFFSNCYSLRSLPAWFVNVNYDSSGINSYMSYSSTFQNCCALSNVILPIPETSKTVTSNHFYYTFNGISRANMVIFSQTSTFDWSNQTIDLTNQVGWGNVANLQNYAGFTPQTLVTNDATYQALKNNPDYYTSSAVYSRYNHDSAVQTLQFLPTVTGTKNTIKFLGQSGQKTDGGAISNLTSSEIAVATAKGWTVTIS